MFIYQFVPDTMPKLCTSTSSLVTLFGGRVDQLQELLVNERISDGWEPVVREQMSFTISSFAPSAFKVEFGVKDTRNE